MLATIVVLQVVILIALGYVWLSLDWRCRRIEKRVRIVHGDLVDGAEYRLKTADQWVDDV